MTADGTPDPLAAPTADGRAGWRQSLGAAIGAVPRSLWRIAALVAGVAVLILVASELNRVLSGLTLAEVKGAMASVSWPLIGLSLAATAGAYLSLIGYEIIALRQVDATAIPRRQAALTAFICYSFTFVLGFGVLTGGAVRLRRYKAAGLQTGQILAVTLLGAVSFWAGLAVVAAVCLVLDPSAIATTLAVPLHFARGTGFAILAILGIWLWTQGRRERTVTLKSWTVRLPGPFATFLIVALGTADVLLSASALWLLIPTTIDVGFAGFIVVFTLATVAGVVSHAPGGLGAFEAVILVGLPGGHHADVAAALILFRVVYYAIPFALALAIFLVGEGRPLASRFAASGRTTARAVAPFVRRFATAAVVLGGVVLLVSGAVPAEGTRLAFLARWVPLPFVETSHFVASAVGTALLIVGYGLVRRRRASLHAAILLLGAGAVFSLAKGFDYEEALVCLLVLALLLTSRRAFYRGGDVFEDAPSLPWLAAVALIVGASIWAGLLAYRNVPYANELWWHFALHGDASRFLRASVAATIVLAATAAYRLMNASSSGPPTATPDPGWVAQMVAKSADPVANLALLGDKCFLRSTVGEGFVMYAVEGSTFLAMGDPVADDPQTAVDLIWRFRELADRSSGDPAFYQVQAALLPHYIDAGFSFAKLGEEAVVDLTRFTLEGSAGAKLRYSKKHCEREGLSFAIVPAAEVPAIQPELQAISAAWLAQQKGPEKGFSLGFWSGPYLSHFDHAVVSLDGRPIAFASLWRSGDRSEMSVDLMRHRPDLPNGTMDYLFVSLMAVAKAEGYAAFNLGLAPMSGLQDHPLAPAWSRFGTLIYKHGNQFYNFRGLREFKAKFKPDWRPRYLAHTGPLAAPRVLLDATRLISRGPQAVHKDCSDASRP